MLALTRSPRPVRTRTSTTTPPVKCSRPRKRGKQPGPSPGTGSACPRRSGDAHGGLTTLTYDVSGRGGTRERRWWRDGLSRPADAVESARRLHHVSRPRPLAGRKPHWEADNVVHHRRTRDAPAHDGCGRSGCRPDRTPTPFGLPTGTSGAPTRVGFGGHDAVGETGLIAMAARDYDPSLGRMISADTVMPGRARNRQRSTATATPTTTPSTSPIQAATTPRQTPTTKRGGTRSTSWTCIRTDCR